MLFSLWPRCADEADSKRLRVEQYALWAGAFSFLRLRRHGGAGSRQRGYPLLSDLILLSMQIRPSPPAVQNENPAGLDPQPLSRDGKGTTTWTHR